MKSCDIVIIGAGISGLSLAHYCAKSGMKTLVVEKAEEVGGCFHTHRTGSGYWLELGAHTCYNSYGNLIGIIEDLGMLESLLERKGVPFRFLVDGKIKSIPSEISFLELLLSAPRIFTLKKAGQSVRSYYSRIVGEKNYDRVFSPLLSAVPSQKADDFPAGMLFKRRPRRKDILKKFSVAGGLQTITESIAGEEGIEVLTGTEAQPVTAEGGGYRVATEDGQVIMAKSLAFAIPPSSAARLLGGAFPELSAELEKIREVTVESVGVVVKKGDVSVEPVAGIVPRSDLFFSAVSRDVVEDEAYRGFSFHFRPGTRHEDKFSRICDVLGVSRNGLADVEERESTLPSPVLGHEAVTGNIDRLIAGKRLLVTGNYFQGLAIEDCVSRSRSEFERLKSLIG